MLPGATTLGEITPQMLDQAMAGLLPHALKRQLDQEAPSHFEAPTGRAIRSLTTAELAPSLAIRVQELYQPRRASEHRTPAAYP